jgi:hypothetical protein
LYVAPARAFGRHFQKWRTLYLAHVIDEAVDFFGQDARPNLCLKNSQTGFESVLLAVEMSQLGNIVVFVHHM